MCGSCSRSKVRLTTGKERVCDECAKEHRAGRTEQLEEAVDVRVQINASLKALLREKFEEIEKHKAQLVALLVAQPYLQEPPATIDTPNRFSPEMFGLGRINFSDLVSYLDERIAFLKSRLAELTAAIATETAQQEERRRNFGFLEERTLRAESDAVRVEELVHQKDRLRETFKLQAATVRALQDRVEMMEQHHFESSRRSNLRSELRLPPDVLSSSQEFLGDRIVQRFFPCL